MRSLVGGIAVMAAAATAAFILSLCMWAQTVEVNGFQFVTPGNGEFRFGGEQVLTSSNSPISQIQSPQIQSNWAVHARAYVTLEAGESDHG